MLPKLPEVSPFEREKYERDSYAQEISRLRESMRDSKKIVFFGGAGVSTESGIPDFRSADGLFSEKYGRLSPERIVSRSFFDAEPEMFYDFYRKKLLYPNAQPNIAHQRLAEYEQAGKDIQIITQNIDGLHQKAGSKNVYELHGSVRRYYCMKCHKSHSMTYIRNHKPLPLCECGGLIKPDVVLYEERLEDGLIYAAAEQIAICDMLIIAGTSLVVNPAASLISYYRGSCVAVINLSKLEMEDRADILIHDKLGTVLEQITAEDIVPDYSGGSEKAD